MLHEELGLVLAWSDAAREAALEARRAKAEVRLPERPWHEPPAPEGKGGKAGGFSAIGITNTKLGDAVEHALQQHLGMKDAHPGARQGPVDLLYGRHAYEVKAQSIAAKEYHAKPKSSEIADKRAFAEEHGLVPHTMIAVYDPRERRVHAYSKEGIGAYRLTGPENGWSYHGSVPLDLGDTWDPAADELRMAAEEILELFDPVHDPETGEFAPEDLEWTPVEGSSNIHSVAWRRTHREANVTYGDTFVRMHHGGVYRYSGVTAQRHSHLVRSLSKGKYVNKMRKAFEGVPVEAKLAEELGWVHWEKYTPPPGMRYNMSPMPSEPVKWKSSDFLKTLYLDEVPVAWHHGGDPFHGWHGEFASAADALEKKAVTAEGGGYQNDSDALFTKQLMAKHQPELDNHIAAMNTALQNKGWHVSRIHLVQQGTGYQAHFHVTPDSPVSKASAKVYRKLNFWKKKDGTTGVKYVQWNTPLAVLPKGPTSPPQPEPQIPDVKSWDEAKAAGLVKSVAPNSPSFKMQKFGFEETIRKRLNNKLTAEYSPWKGAKLLGVELTSPTPKSTQVHVKSIWLLENGTYRQLVDTFWRGKDGSTKAKYGYLAAVLEAPKKPETVAVPAAPTPSVPQWPSLMHMVQADKVTFHDPIPVDSKRWQKIQERLKALEAAGVKVVYLTVTSSTSSPGNYDLKWDTSAGVKQDLLTKSGIVGDTSSIVSGAVAGTPAAKGIQTAPPVKVTKPAKWLKWSDDEQAPLLRKALQQTYAKAIAAAGTSALNFYTGNGFKSINELREVDGDVSKLNSTAASKVRSIDKAMEAAKLDPVIPPESRGIVMWREMNLREVHGLPSELPIGLEYVRQSFSSGSPDRNYANSVGGGNDMVQIFVPRWASAVYMGGHGSHPSENELLLQRGLRFRILANQVSGSKHIVTAEVVGTAEQGLNPNDHWAGQLLKIAKAAGNLTPDARSKLASALLTSQQHKVAAKGKDAELAAHALYAAKLLNLDSGQAEAQAQAELARLEKANDAAEKGDQSSHLAAMADGVDYLTPHLKSGAIDHETWIELQREAARARDLLAKKGETEAPADETVDQATKDLGVDAFSPGDDSGSDYEEDAGAPTGYWDAVGDVGPYFGAPFDAYGAPLAVGSEVKPDGNPTAVSHRVSEVNGDHVKLKGYKPYFVASKLVNQSPDYVPEPPAGQKMLNGAVVDAAIVQADKNFEKKYDTAVKIAGYQLMKMSDGHYNAYVGEGYAPSFSGSKAEMKEFLLKELADVKGEHPPDASEGEPDVLPWDTYVNKDALTPEEALSDLSSWKAHDGILYHGLAVSHHPYEKYDVTNTQTGYFVTGGYGASHDDTIKMMAAAKDAHDASEQGEEIETPPSPWEGDKPHGDMADFGYKVKDLGGTTGAELWETNNGKQWVVKHGADEDQAQKEVIADKIYNEMAPYIGNVKAADSTFEPVEGKPAKVAPFIDGTPLKDVTNKQFVYKKLLQKGFALDALLGNWDVLGLEHDNVINKPGMVYKIDNGGAFDRKAMGGTKDFNAGWPRELWTMRQSSQGKPVFGSLDWQQIVAQMKTISASSYMIYDQIPPSLTADDHSLRNTVEDRIDAMQELVDITDALHAAGASYAQIDKFLEGWTANTDWVDSTVEEAIEAYGKEGE